MYKPFLYCFLFCLLGSNVVAQNLVYNGDFEIYDTCPISPSVPGNLQIERCMGWYAPTQGSSDYFNSCNNGLGIYNVSTPQNFIGFQIPYDGEAYLGIFTYSANTPPCNYNEYIQTELINPLVEGQFYELEFFVSLADNSTAAIKHIGALFTDNQLIKNDACAIEIVPQVYSNFGFISDTINWVKISGRFIASGGEKYLTIGNFEHLPELLPIVPDSLLFDDFASYYYIDGITLKETEALPFPNVITPNNDGNNDYIFFPKYLGNIAYNFYVYNRWGKIVYQSDESSNSWYGDHQIGTNLSDGIYYYIINTSIENINFSGTIQIINN
jgi:gliding motility-associated-like protein